MMSPLHMQEIDARAELQGPLLRRGQLELAQVIADEASAEALAADEPPGGARKEGSSL